MTPADISRVRDAIYEGLLMRQGLVLTESICRDRANNIATGLIADIDDMIAAALKDAARGEVVTGTIEPIGVVRAPRQNPGEPCTKTKWCGDVDGHSGDCIPPF